MRLHRNRTVLALLLAAASAARSVTWTDLPGPVQARLQTSGLSSYDEVRRAVEAGTIHSLDDILRTVRGKLPGEIAGVEVERKNGRWLYEFRVIDGKGRLFDVYVDARSGDIERIKEK